MLLKAASMMTMGLYLQRCRATKRDSISHRGPIMGLQVPHAKVQQLEPNEHAREWEGFIDRCGNPVRIKADQYGIIYPGNSKILFANIISKRNELFVMEGLQKFEAKHDDTLWGVLVKERMSADSTRTRKMYTDNEEMAKDFFNVVENAVAKVPREIPQDLDLGHNACVPIEINNITLWNGTPAKLRYINNRKGDALEIRKIRNGRWAHHNTLLFANIVAEEQTRDFEENGEAVKVEKTTAEMKKKGAKGDYNVQVLAKPDEQSNVKGFRFHVPDKKVAESLRKKIQEFFDASFKRRIEWARGLNNAKAKEDLRIEDDLEDYRLI